MGAGMRRAGVALAVAGLWAVWSGAALAQSTGTRAAGFAYQPGSGLLTREVVEPDLPQFRLQTDYTLDAFGNRTAVTISGADIASRSSSVSFDAKGRFPVSSTNALNHSESWSFDERFGLPASHTSPNALTTSWEYDVFGRKVLELRADGTRTTWSYRFCSGTAGGADACPTGATYLVEMKVLGPDGVTLVSPTTRSYQDQLDRPIATETEGFDGAIIRSLIEYDTFGRVKRKSRPFFLTGGSPVWQTTDYDLLDRPTLETYPDTTTLTYSYNGLIRSTTNARSQTTTTLVNSQDQIVAVTDAANETISYRYDPFGNLRQVTDPAGNVTSYTYDRRGRKIAELDPDQGAWSGTYNVLDQIISQTDAKNQTTTASYDLLGRMTARSEPGQSYSWVYDTATKGIGKLASATTHGGAYQRLHGYDSLGRPSQTKLTIDAANYSFTTSYDFASRVSEIIYPSGMTVGYSYNARGYQTQLRNVATGEVYWTANARDAELRLTQQTAGNGVATTQSFDPLMGYLTAIQAGPGSTVQNFAYSYDAIGNLLSRSDANNALSESFTYDNLNRLTSATVGVNITKSFSYNKIGNLLSKSDVGTYIYPAAGQPFPHAVSSISGSIVNTTFSYDPNGNLTSGNGLAISYTPFNKPETISRGAHTISFAHDPEYDRYKQISSAGTSLYLNDGEIKAELLIGAGGIVQWTNYLIANGGMIGMRVERSDSTVLTRYFHKDHLGSIATLTDETGAIAERLAYGPWGQRRHANGQDDPAGSLTSQTSRGFTGHEQLDQVGLIHMNGRVYDPLIARFTSPDPYTPEPYTTQGWNRYTYVSNNPLAATDPTGHSEFGGGNEHSGDSVTTGPGSGNSGGDGGRGDGGHAGGRAASASGENVSGAQGVDSLASANDNDNLGASSSATVSAPAPQSFARAATISAPPKAAAAPAAIAAPATPSGSEGGGGGGGGGGPGNAGSSGRSSGTGISGVTNNLLVGTVNLVPGAVYAGQAEEAFLTKQYLSGIVYTGMSFVDAVVGTLSLGASSIAQVPGRMAPRGVETFYRSMSQSHFDTLTQTGKLTATAETFISPTRGFAAEYRGVLVEFTMSAGTTRALQGIGVRDVSKIARNQFPSLPIVQKGWATRNAYFKGEGIQVNIGLGRGPAIDIFNQNILGIRELAR
jgi:RHS repeat-associated protein